MFKAMCHQRGCKAIGNKGSVTTKMENWETSFINAKGISFFSKKDLSGSSQDFTAFLKCFNNEKGK